ncbi:Cytochrome P450 [Apiospora arundinis]
MMSPSHLDEALRVDSALLDTHKHISKLLAEEYVFGGYGVPLSVAAHESTLMRGVSKNLNAMTPAICDETAHALEQHWGGVHGEWQERHIMAACADVVGQITNRMLVGLPLCRDQTFLRRAKRWSRVVLQTAWLIYMLPDFVKPFLAPLLAVPSLLCHQRALQMVIPVAQERLEKRQKRATDASSCGWDEPPDYMKFLLDEGSDAFNHALDHDATTLARAAFMVNAAAFHATGLTLANILLDVFSAPTSTTDALRAEAAAIQFDYGLDSKLGLSKMTKMDSAIRESMRLHVLGIKAMHRYVNPKEGFTFSNGDHVPYGAHLSLPVLGRHLDEHLYPNATQYDAFRFSRERDGDFTQQQQQSHDAHSISQKNTRVKAAVNASPNHLAWGIGKSQCPGRFFAVDELKLIMAHVLIYYEVQRIPLQIGDVSVLAPPRPTGMAPRSISLAIPTESRKFPGQDVVASTIQAEKYMQSVVLASGPDEDEREHVTSNHRGRARGKIIEYSWEKNGGRPVKIRLAHEKPAYILSNAQDVQRLFRASKELTFEEFSVRVLEKVKKFPREDGARMEADTSGSSAVPFHNVPESSRIWRAIHCNYDSNLTGSDSVSILTTRFVSLFREELDRITTPENDAWTAGCVNSLLEDKMFRASTRTLVGDAIFDISPSFTSDFWDYDKNFMYFLYGLPRFLFPSAWKARERVFDAVKGYIAQAWTHLDPRHADGCGGLDFDDHFGSRLVRTREAMYANYGLSLDGRAASEMGLIWSINSNAIPMVSWMLIEILSDPQLLFRVQQEILGCTPATQDISSASLDVQRVLTLPLLNSCYAECLRMRASVQAIRELRTEIQMGGLHAQAGKPRHGALVSGTL